MRQRGGCVCVSCPAFVCTDLNVKSLFMIREKNRRFFRILITESRLTCFSNYYKYRDLLLAMAKVGKVSWLRLMTKNVRRARAHESCQTIGWLLASHHHDEYIVNECRLRAREFYCHFPVFSSSVKSSNSRKRTIRFDVARISSVGSNSKTLSPKFVCSFFCQFFINHHQQKHEIRFA